MAKKPSKAELRKKYPEKTMNPEAMHEMEQRAKRKKERTDKIRTARPADDWRTRRPNTPKES